MKLLLILIVTLPLVRNADIKNDKNNKLQFENLVLEGGGSKAISYVGAILALKEAGYYKNGQYTFNKIGGTSAGCFAGFMITMDIKPSKLEALVYQMDLFKNSVTFDTELFNANTAPEKSSSHTWFNTILKTFMLISKAQDIVDLWLDHGSPGMSTDEMFNKFIIEVILPLSPHKREILNLQTLTFRELLQITGHDLHCFATQLTDKSIYEFSSEQTPHEHVIKALYASMTLPGIFKPLNDGFGNTLVDGGLLYNFPITMNDNSVVDTKTLGLSLNANLGDEHALTPRHKDVSVLKQKFKFNTMSTTEYIEALYSVIINRESLLYSRNPINKNRVIYLDSPINTLDLNIDPNYISLAINKAYLNTLTFLKGLK